MDRYWVGGTGNWNTTAHWSTTSGGSGGASIPTSSDNVIFDTNSHNDNYTVTLPNTISAYCNDFTANNPTGKIATFIANYNLHIYGSLYLGSNISFTGMKAIIFKATSTGKTITTNGCKFSYNSSATFDGVGGEWILQDDIDFNISSMYLVRGTLDANNKNITARSFDGSNSNTRTLKMGSGTWSFSQVGTIWNLGTTTNLTFDSGTSTIKFTGNLGSNVRTFKGGGLTYYNFENHVFSTDLATNPGKVVIDDSNTFNSFNVNGNIYSYPTRVEFTAGTTQTVSSFKANGKANFGVIIQSSDTSIFTLSCPSGTINCNYIDLSYSTATGGATWNAIDSIDSGNNTGWIFSTSTVAPTVTTQSATNVAQTSCTGNGNITDTGGENATCRGFCYKVGTSGDPTTSDSVAYNDGSFGTGAYTKSITGLSANTSYRIRAYAVNSAGTSYGTTVSVKTLTDFIPRTTWFL